MMLFTDSLNSSIRMFSYSLILYIRYFIVVVKSFCVIYYEFKEARVSVVVLVKFVGPESVFVDGYILINIDWVGIVKSSEL